MTGHGESGVRNRHTFGGLTDAAFRMIPLLEAGRNAAWPWGSELPVTPRPYLERGSVTGPRAGAGDVRARAPGKG